MIDFESIKIFYKFGQNITLSDVKVIFQAAKTKSYLSGEYLLQEKDTKREVFFIRKGLVRVYKINGRGDEITTCVRAENQVIACKEIILFNQPSQIFCETLEPTDVFYINYDLLETILSQNPRLEAGMKYIYQNLLKEALQRVDSFVLLNPEERYLDYVRTNPKLINRVPNKYTANILGITPVSLSRIRKRISSKK